MRHTTRLDTAAASMHTRTGSWQLPRMGVIGAVLLGMGCAGPGLAPAGPAPGEVDVGYGHVPVGKVTGATKSVSEKEVVTAGAIGLPDLLRGRVPGLQVIGSGASVTYRIRGTSSFHADESPLFVVNGVPTSAEQLATALAGVMMEDVRQVDVLKDVASTSIFGSRGAGGVIVITTRR